jgi:hypothetical protein
MKSGLRAVLLAANGSFLASEGTSAFLKESSQKRLTCGLGIAESAYLKKARRSAG